MYKKEAGSESGSGNARVTQQDIADAVGISSVTVSLALRDSSRISKKTRDKVKEAARKLGYVPDPMLQSLSSYRRASKAKPADSVIAWIRQRCPPGAHGCEEEVSRCLAGAAAVAGQHGYRIDTFDTGEQRPVRLAQILETRGIHGLILLPLVTIDMRQFPIERFSVVRIGSQALHKDTHRIAPAHTSNVFMAFEKMRARGYQRIGYITTGTSTWGAVSEHFCRFQEQLSGGDQPLLLLNESSRADQCRRLDAWIRSNQPEAILSDIPGMQERLEQIGLRVPQDIGLAGTSIVGTALGAGIDPKLEEVGQLAFLTLNNLIQQRKQGLPDSPFSVLVDGIWVDGPSLPAIPEVRAELVI